VAEQRYKAVEAVLALGQTITQVARDWGVSRQTIHGWLAKYEGDGLEGLGNRSRRPAHCRPRDLSKAGVDQSQDSPTRTRGKGSGSMQITEIPFAAGRFGLPNP